MYKKYLLQGEREVQQAEVKKNLKSEKKKNPWGIKKKKKYFLKLNTHSDKNRKIKVKCLYLDKSIYKKGRKKNYHSVCVCVRGCGCVNALTSSAMSNSLQPHGL